MGKLFGTDGVRGVANLELTPELAYAVGRFGAFVLTKHMDHTPVILVGRDTRVSGDMLESALVAGVLSVGAHVKKLNIIPTPAVAHLIRQYKADAGVVISASHNSVEYNGIKYFNSEGFKLSDELEEEIESYIFGERTIDQVPGGDQVGVKIRCPQALDDYVRFAVSTADGRLDGLKVAVDCANGAAYRSGPMALEQLGAQVEVIFNEPTGFNINKGCGSTHIQRLQEFVKECGADIGLAFDGDADRLIAVDEMGAEIDGDVIMGLLAIDLKNKGKLKNNAIIATVMSNLGLTQSLRQHGIEVYQTKVGDRYVLEELIKTGCVLGGEQSGHIILMEQNTTGDGLVSAISLLGILKRSGKKASQLAEQITILPQVLVNAKIKNENKPKLEEDEKIKTFVTQLNQKYSGIGRLLVRVSGTEPLIRVMIEGKDKNDMEKDASALAALIEESLG